MAIFFRADSSGVIGSGHIRRCLTLAEMFRSRGLEICFLTRAMPQDSAHLIDQAGFSLKYVGKCRSDVKEATVALEGFESDAENSIAVINAFNSKPSLMIVDHYGLSASWEKRVIPFCDRLLVIDDLSNRPHFADGLLDQNYRPTAKQLYRSLVNESCRLFLGPSYVILRHEFIGTSPIAIEDTKKRLKVFVFFGATDPVNATGEFIKGIDVLNQEFEFVILVGAENPYRCDLRVMCEPKTNMRLIEGSNDVASLMKTCDLAVAAGGTNTWERCAVGLPSVVIATAPNQETVSMNLSEAGAILYAGNASRLNWVNHAFQLLSRLRLDFELRTSLQRKGLEILNKSGMNQLVNWALSPLPSISRENT